MELYDVMRTTFAAREFTDDPLPDEVLSRIIDNARFAPSGGNRQGAHLVLVTDRETREALARISEPATRRRQGVAHPHRTGLVRRCGEQADALQCAEPGCEDRRGDAVDLAG